MHSAIKAIKKQLILFPQWKLIVFMVVVVVVFIQFQKYPINWRTIQLFHPALLLPIVGLVFLHWFLEYKKWLLTCTNALVVKDRIELLQSFQKGMIAGFLSPGAQGNFIGRMFAFSKKENKTLVPLTIVSNFSQFLISVSVGLMVLMLLPNPVQNQFSYPFNSLSLLVSCSALFVLIWGLFWFLPIEKMAFLQNKWMKTSRISSRYRLQVSGLSLIRYIIFVAQFYSMLWVFSPSVDWSVMGGISILFLFTTLSPSLFFGKLFIRELVAIWVLSAYQLDTATVVVSAFFIWVLNNFLPMLLAFSQMKAHGR